MSLQYLLDGYNIIHQMPMDLKDNIEDQRKRLVIFIETKRPQGSLNNKVAIIFDGRVGIYGRIDSSIVKIIFSKDISADDKIKQIVSQAGNKKRIVVVTDDREIKYAIGALGAKALSVKEFLAAGVGRKKMRGIFNREASEESTRTVKRISRSTECRITEELKKVWLKDK